MTKEKFEMHVQKLLDSKSPMLARMIELAMVGRKPNVKEVK